MRIKQKKSPVFIYAAREYRRRRKNISYKFTVQEKRGPIVSDFSFFSKHKKALSGNRLSDFSSVPSLSVFPNRHRIQSARAPFKASLFPGHKSAVFILRSKLSGPLPKIHSPAAPVLTALSSPFSGRAQKTGLSETGRLRVLSAPHAGAFFSKACTDAKRDRADFPTF